MISKGKFEMAVHSKIGFLTNYYKIKHKISTEQAYIYVRNTGIVDILNNKDSRLYLESPEFLIYAIEKYNNEGRDAMIDFLESNIGG